MRDLSRGKFRQQITFLRRQFLQERDIGGQIFPRIPIDDAPDAEMRLIIVLSRYGGLRIPSEPFAMRWQDIDWKRQRITVRCVKTEHHDGHETRELPLFPEIMPELLEVQERAEPGEEFVIAKRSQTTDANLRRRMAHIVRKAGFEPWPRIFHNLRASRQTELEDQFPSHVVCQWLGNSEAVARDHYLQTLDSHFEKATQHLQKLTETDAKTTEHDLSEPFSESVRVPVISRVFASVIGQLGRSPTEAEGNRTVGHKLPDGHDFGNDPAAPCAISYASVLDPDLETVIDAWDELPTAIRRAIAGLVHSQQGSER